MNTDHIHYFLVTIQCGSINKASEKLNINHQHLGRILTSLENEIGAKLLERNRGGIILTQQGMEVLELMNGIDSMSQQLKNNFNMNPIVKSRDTVLKIYSFAMINNTKYNRFLQSMQNLMPKLSIEMQELPNDEILKCLQENEVASLGELYSFDDYPALCLKKEHLPSDLEIITEKSRRLAMLTSTNNPLGDQYNSISIESLIKKPVVIYCPYDVEENHFYKLMKVYGDPNIKYKTKNLQTFYELLRNTECVAIGATADSATTMLNPLFRKEDQLRMIPVREDITFTTIQVVNKILKKESGTVLRDLIDRHFTI